MNFKAHILRAAAASLGVLLAACSSEPSQSDIERRYRRR